MSLAKIGVTEGSDAYILVDEIGGTGYPVSKMMLGSAGSNDNLVGDTNPVPIKDWLHYSKSDGTKYKTVNKFGKVSNLSTSDAYVWRVGGDYYWQTLPSAVNVAVGGNPEDSEVGNGARTIVVQGLGEDWQEYEEQITLSGSIATVPTTGNFIRTFRAAVLDVGQYTSSNSGEISILEQNGNQVCHIDSNRGQSQMAIYTVPSGYSAYLKDITGYADANQNKVVQLRLMQRPEAYNTGNPKASRVVHEFSNVNGQFKEEMFASASFSEMTDLYFLASADSSSNLHVSFQLLLEKN